MQRLGLRHIADTQCGFKLFRRSVAQDLFSVTCVDGYAFDLELLYIARQRGYRIAEVPVNWTDQPGSKVRPWRDGFVMLRELMAIRKREAQGRYMPRLLRPMLSSRRAWRSAPNLPTSSGPDRLDLHLSTHNHHFGIGHICFSSRDATPGSEPARFRVGSRPNPLRSDPARTTRANPRDSDRRNLERLRRSLIRHAGIRPSMKIFTPGRCQRRNPPWP